MRFILKNISFNLSSISIFFLFLLMLWSMNPWFSWHYWGIMVFFFTCCFLLLRLALISNKINNYSITVLSLFAAAFAFLVYSMMYLRRAEGIPDIYIFIRTVLVFFLVISMHPKEQENIVTITTTAYALLVGISMFAYLLVVIGIELPYSIIDKPDDRYPPFLNFRLFIIGMHESVFLKRFQSVFTEPGHLSTISALFLYVNRYELKRKSVLIILISLLLSLSLSGYFLLFLGYFIQVLTRSKRLFKTVSIIVIVTVMLAGIGYFYYIVYPDSLFSSMILSRLEYYLFSEGGPGFIQDRTSKHFDYYYETQFLKSTEEVLWGKGPEFGETYFKRMGMSYKVFLFRNGIITIILLFFLYLSIVSVKPTRQGFGLLFLYTVSFLQRTYALWEMQLFLFIGAIQYFYTESYGNKECIERQLKPILEEQ